MLDIHPARRKRNGCLHWMQVEQITEADKGALQKPENQEDKVSSKINLMELQMFKPGGAVFGYSDLEHGNQDNSADPDGKCRVEWGHGRTVIFNRVHFVGFQLYRCSEEGADAVLIAGNQVFQFGKVSGCLHLAQPGSCIGNLFGCCLQQIRRGLQSLLDL